MSTKTLPQLPSAGAISTGDLLHISQSGVDAGVTANSLAQYAMRLSQYSQANVAVSGTYSVSISPLKDQTIYAAVAATPYTITFPAITSGSLPMKVLIEYVGTQGTALTIAGLSNMGGSAILTANGSSLLVFAVQTGSSTYGWCALSSAPFVQVSATSLSPSNLQGVNLFQFTATGQTLTLTSASSTPGTMVLVTYTQSSGSLSVVLSGSLTETLTAYGSLMVVWDGTIWHTVTEANSIIAASGTTTLPYVHSDTTLVYNNASAGTFDITAGGHSGTILKVVNLAASGTLTVKVSGSVSYTVSAGEIQSYLQAYSVGWMPIDRSDAFVSVTSGSSMTIVPFQSGTYVNNTLANPYTFTLPQASTCIGYRVRIVAGRNNIQNLTVITPYSGDSIGQTPVNTSCYLQNVDGGGAPYLNQFLDLVATAYGNWAVVAGQFCPHQATDTDGSQYHLGKFHHLPLTNTTSRQIASGTPPSSGFGGGITATGVVGVPSGAKAVRVKVNVQVYAAAAGTFVFRFYLSDNGVTYTPSNTTAHPQIYITGYATAAGTYVFVAELDVPVNSSGQMFLYTEAITNVTIASSVIQLVATGFWMGD